MQEIIISQFKVIDKLDLVIFSDFNYGCLPQALVDEITEIAKSKNIFIAADSQSSSQFGDVSRFKVNPICLHQQNEKQDLHYKIIMTDWLS